MVAAGSAGAQALEAGSRFGLLDGTLVVLYLAFTLWLGLRARGYVGSLTAYLVAGRALRTHLAIATMIGSELGLVTVMYAAQKGFTGGFAAFHIGLVAGVAALVIGCTGFIVGGLRRLEVMTIPEFYELRFGRGVRVFGGLLLALSGILNMGLFLKAGATFVTGLCGLTDPWIAKLVMTALIALVLVYTVLGGMVSVVLTDYVQFVVLSLGMLAACGFALARLGWEPLVDAVRTVHGPAGFNPFDEEGFGPDYVVWMIFTAGIVSCAVWQTAVVRACSASSVAVVKRLYVWSSVGFLVRFLVPQFLGVCALAWFWNGGAPREAFLAADGTIVADASLNALPVFLGELLPAGALGLIAAGMLAAFLSTHDSYLLCWASVLAHDVAAPLSRGRLSAAGELALARVLIVLIGVFLLVWSLWFPLGQDLWDYMAVTGAIYFTGAFALLLGGLYWPRASRVGALLALVAGAFSLLGLAPVQQALGLTTPGNRWESEEVGLGAAGAALAAMLLGSLLFPDRPAVPAAEALDVLGEED